MTRDLAETTLAITLPSAHISVYWRVSTESVSEEKFLFTAPADQAPHNSHPCHPALTPKEDSLMLAPAYGAPLPGTVRCAAAVRWTPARIANMITKRFNFSCFLWRKYMTNYLCAKIFVDFNQIFVNFAL